MDDGEKFAYESRRRRSCWPRCRWFWGTRRPAWEWNRHPWLKCEIWERFNWEKYFLMIAALNNNKPGCGTKSYMWRGRGKRERCRRDVNKEIFTLCLILNKKVRVFPYMPKINFSWLLRRSRFLMAQIKGLQRKLRYLSIYLFDPVLSPGIADMDREKA